MHCYNALSQTCAEAIVSTEREIQDALRWGTFSLGADQSHIGHHAHQHPDTSPSTAPQPAVSWGPLAKTHSSLPSKKRAEFSITRSCTGERSDSPYDCALRRIRAYVKQGSTTGCLKPLSWHPFIGREEEPPVNSHMRSKQEGKVSPRPGHSTIKARPGF